MSKVLPTLGSASGQQQRVDQLCQRLLANCSRSRFTVEAVHRIRTDCKKLRAWTRLVASGKQRKPSKAIARVLRETAKGFSAARDADVQRALLKQLLGKVGSAATRVAIRRLQRHTPASPASALSRQQQRLLAATLKPLGTAVKVDRETAERALRRHYKRARRCEKKCRSEPAASERFHELRKRVKELNYQLGLLEGTLQPLRRQLTSLGTALGALHDWQVMLARLNADTTVLTVAQRQRLQRLLATRLRSTHQRILSQCQQCFAVKPAMLQFFAMAPDKLPAVS